jgi:hypothetical protein
MRVLIPAIAGMMLALSGCSSDEELKAPVTGVAGTSEMKPLEGVSNAWTYFDPDADLSQYKKLMIGPAQVYSGPGADFADLPSAEVNKIAQMLPTEAKKALQKKYPIVTQPGPGVARLNFILVRVEKTVPYVSTVSRIFPIGAVVNLGKAAADQGGTLTGALTVVVEAFDSQTGQLLASAQRRVTPGVFDLSATMGTEETAQAVAEEIGQLLLRKLDEIQTHRKAAAAG